MIILFYLAYLGLGACCNILIPKSFFFFPFSKFWICWICRFGFGALSIAEYLSPVAEVKWWSGGVLQHCILALGTCRQVHVSNTANALLCGAFFETKFCRFPGKT